MLVLSPPTAKYVAHANPSTQSGRSSTQASTLPPTSQTSTTVPPPIRSTNTGLYIV